jgi:apolipoprotein N-acyltransferase
LVVCHRHVTTWWWLYISLHTYGGLAAPLAVIAIVGLHVFFGALLRSDLRIVWGDCNLR